VLGGRLMGADMAADILQAWLETDFTAGRHSRRVAKIADIEARHAGDRAGGSA
jgi:ribose 5-phosphate isomerase B